MTKLQSAGVIIVRFEKETPYFLLLGSFDFWDFPKGNIERDENKIQAAIREVKEESGIEDLNFNKKFDYLFIDADHNYEAVKRDFEEWYPKLEVGGFIALHDSAANRGGPYWWDGPSKLADELIETKELEYIKTVYTLTLFKKIK